MASNQEEAVKRAVAKGDAAGALSAYESYRASMERAGQRPKSPSELGIKKQ